MKTREELEKEYDQFRTTVDHIFPKMMSDLPRRTTLLNDRERVDREDAEAFYNKLAEVVEKTTFVKSLAEECQAADGIPSGDVMDILEQPYTSYKIRAAGQLIPLIRGIKKPWKLSFCSMIGPNCSPIPLVTVDKSDWGYFLVNERASLVRSRIGAFIGQVSRSRQKRLVANTT